jgi:3-hydroxyisobutyryl-CoA hydrolase
MNQLDGQIGTWLAVTGRDVFGREAYELGIATHYVAEEAVPEIKERLAALEAPSAAEISEIVAEYHLAGSEGLTSKTNPSGRTPIVSDVRHFLDEAFALPSLKALYTRLVEAETDAALSPEVQAWVKEQRGIMDTRGPTGMAVAIENYHSAARAKRLARSYEQDMLVATGFVGQKRSCNDLMVGAVHSLFEKKKTPMPFSPAITELDAPTLQPESIRANFFDRASPHLFDAPPMEVGDGLLPPPKTVNGPDSNWGRFRRFGLPAEESVRAVIDDARGKITHAEIVERVVGHETHPARRAEFEAAAWRIIAERTSEGTAIQWN